jgi:hypothetical protein
MAMSTTNRRLAAIVSSAALLALLLVGCSGQGAPRAEPTSSPAVFEPEELIAEPELEPTPTPTPPPSYREVGGFVTFNATGVEVVNASGYALEVDAEISLEPFKSDITNAPVGFTTLVQPVPVHDVTITNATPGRVAGGALAVSAWSFYPIDSPLCTGGSQQWFTYFDDLVWRATPADGPLAGQELCLQQRSPTLQWAISEIGIGETVEATVPTTQYSDYTTVTPNVPEDLAAELLGAYNNPLATVLLFGGAESSPDPDACSVPAGSSSVLVWDPAHAICP